MEKLTIEQKAEAYDEALKKLRTMRDAWNNLETDYSPKDVVRDIEYYFPELADSENERIRKGLIDFLEYYRLNNVLDSKTICLLTDSVVWLEKQGEQKSIWHNEDEEPKRGSLILLIMQSGTPIVAKIIEPNHTFNHGERWAYIDDLLEKQGKQKHSDIDNKFIRMRETKPKNIAEFLDRLTTVEQEFLWEHIAKIRELDKEEQKSTGKIKPRFKFGNWVVIDSEVLCIKEVTEDGYLTDEGGLIPFRCDKEAHLWTIQDAKAGDVLYLQKDGKEHIIIYKGVIKERFRTFVSAYCAYNGIVDAFCFADVSRYVDIAYGGIMPATKEQRDTLMKAMADDGYEWDAEKKELRKIENEIEIPFGAKDSELEEVSYNIPNGYHAEIEDNKVVIKKGEQKHAEWSEEDEENLKWFEKFFRAESVIAEGKDIPQDRYLWFKNLKGRVQPKQEWSKEDERIKNNLLSELTNLSVRKLIEKETENKYVNWLKSLRPQNTWKPSDEQIKAVKLARSFVVDDFDEHPTLSEILIELEEQLKKLKE